MDVGYSRALGVSCTHCHDDQKFASDEKRPKRAAREMAGMVNYRVEDVQALVAALKAEGCNVLDKIDDSEYGKFGWVIDPEGNKVELWQPPAGQ